MSRAKKSPEPTEKELDEWWERRPKNERICKGIFLWVSGGLASVDTQGVTLITEELAERIANWMNRYVEWRNDEPK